MTPFLHTPRHRTPSIALTICIALSVGPSVRGQSPPDAAGALRQDGLEAFAEGRLAAALDAYAQAIEAAPDREQLYLEMTDIYLAAGLPGDAETQLARTRAYFPRSGQPAYNLLYHDLAELWASKGRLRKASDAMTEATGFDGPVDPAVSWRRIGDFNTDLMRLDIALDAYRNALAAALPAAVRWPASGSPAGQTAGWPTG